MTRDGRVCTSQKTADTVRAAKRSAAQCDETADAPESKRLRTASLVPLLGHVVFTGSQQRRLLDCLTASRQARRQNPATALRPHLQPRRHLPRRGTHSVMTRCSF